MLEQLWRLGMVLLLFCDAGGALFLFLVVFLAFDLVHSACSVHSTYIVVRRLVLVPHLYRRQSSRQILYIYIYLTMWGGMAGAAQHGGHYGPAAGGGEFCVRLVPQSFYFHSVLADTYMFNN